MIPAAALAALLAGLARLPWARRRARAGACPVLVCMVVLSWSMLARAVVVGGVLLAQERLWAAADALLGDGLLWLVVLLLAGDLLEHDSHADADRVRDTAP